jgi:regulator of protease activity HflC (stomatin/prohibitin superfamily)
MLPALRNASHAALITQKALFNQAPARNLSLGCFYIVPQQKRVVLERFGKFEKLLMPGIHLKWPLIEEAREIEWSWIDGDRRKTGMMSHIDLRETPHYIPSQKVITQDNVAMTIDGILYASISDPEKVAYSVKDVNAAIESLAQTTLRDVVGRMTLDETSKSRDLINKILKEKLQASADRWGITVNHIELKEILPPKDIQHAMELQMKAEREKRATILTAQGQREAAIHIAEGDKISKIREAEGRNQATILDAEAQAKARFALAEAEARSMEIVQKAAPGQNALAYLIATKYINALPSITEGKSGKTVVVPYDASSLAAATSLIKNFLAESKTTSEK